MSENMVGCDKGMAADVLGRIADPATVFGEASVSDVIAEL